VEDLAKSLRVQWGMNVRKILKTALAVVLVIVVLVVLAFAFIFLDLINYTATGSETLKPAGASIGRALVVYDLASLELQNRQQQKLQTTFRQRTILLISREYGAERLATRLTII